ncbi:hypothetical protein UFOVP1165_64 [uncultured Caudovirales phage]|uniref:Uncharacterized protein n=1 Tax=uncultured Caudovirales phage TaxID=2100421 RepID=A0A6J5R3N4_9CAUD|nr:hypothetical protein UFOVP1165_64 [uncultured Caudovirales phage]
MIRAVSSIPAVNAAQTLFVLRSADFQLATDQNFTKLFAGTNYLITSIVAVRKTGGASVACAGGIYSAAAKGGNALVAAAQNWVTLAANVNVVATLAAVASTALCNTTPVLSLTTGSTAAITADVFISGYIID